MNFQNQRNKQIYNLRNKQRIRFYIKNILFFFVFMIVSGIVFAEISPKYYKEMQEKASEILVIKAIEVKKEFCLLNCTNREIRVKAEIVKVYRSATWLKKDQIIHLRYNHFSPKRGWVGPAPIPVLQAGQTYTAFLHKSSDTTKEPYYQTAARGYSFHPLIPLKEEVEPVKPQ